MENNNPEQGRINSNPSPSPERPKTALGLEENLESLLCYALGWITGIIFFVIEKDNKLVKFHAMQSVLVFGAIQLIMVIPFLNSALAVFVMPLSFILWLLLMYKAYKGERFKLPIVGNIAERNTN